MDIAKGLIAIGAGLAVMTGMMTGIGEGNRLIFFIVEEIVVEVQIPSAGGIVENMRGELFELATLPFCGTPESFAAVNETGNLYDIEQIELRLRSDVLHIVRHEFRSEPVFSHGFHAERVGDRRLAHADNVARLDCARRLDRNVSNHDAPFLAGLGGDCARLEYAHGPYPFIYSDFFRHLDYLLLKSHMAV